MPPKPTVFAAAIVAAALASPAGIVQAAPVAPVQPAAGNTAVMPVAYYRHGYRGHYYHHPYRYRRYGYNWRRPYYYGAYAYQPAVVNQGYSYQPNYNTGYCPYYGSNDLWWCH